MHFSSTFFGSRLPVALLKKGHIGKVTRFWKGKSNISIVSFFEITQGKRPQTVNERQLKLEVVFWSRMVTKCQFRQNSWVLFFRIIRKISDFLRIFRKNWPKSSEKSSKIRKNDQYSEKMTKFRQNLWDFPKKIGEIAKYSEK